MTTLRKFSFTKSRCAIRRGRIWPSAMRDRAISNRDKMRSPC
jgi:hypothetical protein